MPAYSPAEIHTLFRSVFNLGDVEALTALYERRAILAVDNNSVLGRENIRKALKNILLRHGRMTLETRSVVDSPLGLALLHGGWVVERDTGTESELVTRGLSTEVVRKQQDKTWPFVIDNPYTPE